MAGFIGKENEGLTYAQYRELEAKIGADLARALYDSLPTAAQNTQLATGLLTADQQAAIPAGASGVDPLLKASQGYTPASSSHGTTYSPAGLWQFDNALTDDSGNGYTLPLANGATAYRAAYNPERTVHVFDGATDYKLLAASAANLQITGDLTIMMIARFTKPGTRQLLCGISHSGETEAENTLYYLTLEATNILRYSHEYGAGVNEETFTTNYEVPLYIKIHLTMRRSSNVIQWFLDGDKFGEPSSALTTPTGGGSANFYVGGYEGGSFLNGHMDSLCVIPSALTDSQIQEASKIVWSA